MKKRIRLCCFALLLAGFAASAGAVDNPDAPDYLAEFERRAHPFAAAVQQARTGQESASAYARYETFLDRELNQVYSMLLAKVGAAQQAKMKESQRAWLKYRDAEFNFIAHNWTTANFGSSAALSRGGYRTMLIRERVVLLLSYLKNY